MKQLFLLVFCIITFNTINPISTFYRKITYRFGFNGMIRDDDVRDKNAPTPAKEGLL